jgi:hypothetical protein
MNANMIMMGKIGGSVIVNEDINKFFSSIKDIDWTDNNIYKPAKICEVKPTFTVNSNHSEDKGFQSKISLFDQFLIEDNSNHLNDFKAYKSDFEDRMMKINEKIVTQKSDFLQFIGIDGVDEKSDKMKILEAINNNMSNIINNSKLKDKISNLVMAMEQSNTNLNQPNNYQSMNNPGYMNQLQPNYVNNPNYMQQNIYNQNQQRINSNQGNFNNNNYNNYNINPYK